jgi:hypothetical protein
MNQSEKIVDLSHIGTIGFRRIWKPFMEKYKCEYICELGVFNGDNFMQMIMHDPKLAVAIDTWQDNGTHPRKMDDYTQKEFDKQYAYFKGRVADKPFVKIVRDFTTKAARQFDDNFFDLVFIDADHTFEGCYLDLLTWYPKIKPGKFLTGHDYGHRIRRKFGVYDAVNKFAEEHNLEIARFGHSNWAIVKPDNLS